MVALAVAKRGGQSESTGGFGPVASFDFVLRLRREALGWRSDVQQLPDVLVLRNASGVTHFTYPTAENPFSIGADHHCA